MFSTRRCVIAVVIAAYFYFLLPATATFFYELYHLTEIGPVYWGYSIFKAAGYYFGAWPYQLHACIVLALLVLLLPAAWRKLRGA